MATFYLPGEGKTPLQLNHQWTNNDFHAKKRSEREERGSGGPILRDPMGINPMPYHRNHVDNRNKNNNEQNQWQGGGGEEAGSRGRGRMGNRGKRGGRGRQMGGRGRGGGGEGWGVGRGGGDFRQRMDYGFVDDQQQQQGGGAWGEHQNETFNQPHWEVNLNQTGFETQDYANEIDYGRSSSNSRESMGRQDEGKVLRFSRYPVNYQEQQNEQFPPAFEQGQFPSASFDNHQQQRQGNEFDNHSQAQYQQNNMHLPTSTNNDSRVTPQQTQNTEPPPPPPLLSVPVLPGNFSTSDFDPNRPPPSLLSSLPYQVQEQSQITPNLNPFFEAVKAFNQQQNFQPVAQPPPPPPPLFEQHTLPYEVSARNSFTQFNQGEQDSSSPWYSSLPVQPGESQNVFDNTNASETASDQGPWFKDLIPNTKAAKSQFFPKNQQPVPKKINPFAIPYNNNSTGVSQREQQQSRNQQNEIVVNPLFKKGTSDFNEWYDTTDWRTNQSQDQGHQNYSSPKKHAPSPQPLMSIPIMDSDQLGEKPFQFNQALSNKGMGRGRGRNIGQNGGNQKNNLQHSVLSKKPCNYNTPTGQGGSAGGQSSTVTNRLLGMANGSSGEGTGQTSKPLQHIRPGANRNRINFSISNGSASQQPNSNKKKDALLPTPKLIPYPPPPRPKPVERNPRGILKKSGDYTENFVGPGYFDKDPKTNNSIVAYGEDDDDDDIEYLGDVPANSITNNSQDDDMTHDFFSSKMVQHFAGLLKGKSLEDQLEGLLTYILLSPDFLNSRVGIVRNLHELLTYNYKNCTLHPYGADYIGIGNSDDSVNIFVDLTGKQASSTSIQSDNLQPAEISRENVDELLKLLRQEGKDHELFGQIVKRTNFGRINLPVISFVHKGTRVRCNIRFENFFLVQEAKIVQFITSLDIRIIPLLGIVRYWSSVHKVLDTPEEDTKNRFMSMLLLFFLARKKIIPTMGHLQSLAVKPEYYENFDISFCDDYELVPKNENDVLDDKNIFTLSTLALLKEFFNVFANANLKNEVVCLWNAEFIPKDNFSPELEAKMLPADFRKRYRYGVNGKVRERRLDCFSRLCMQDFQDLTENLTQAIPDFDVSKFQIECEIAVGRLEKLMASGSGDIMDLFVITEYDTSTTP